MSTRRTLSSLAAPVSTEEIQAALAATKADKKQEPTVSTLKSLNILVTTEEHGLGKAFHEDHCQCHAAEDMEQIQSNCSPQAVKDPINYMSI